MTLTVASDAHLCPLCGQPNQCAAAGGKNNALPTHCWCFSTRIPAAALERLPSELRGQRCICAACAAQSTALIKPIE
ncbi:MAG TPA: cysteine-rich CWC family protein [Burkholderiaceae bacterium]